MSEPAPSSSRKPSQYSVHTINENPPDGREADLVPTHLLPVRVQAPVVEVDGVEVAAGVKTGHGTVAWIPVTEHDMPPKPSQLPTSSSPVVVVLDSGVKPHSWLPHQDVLHPKDTDFWFSPPGGGPSFDPPIQQDPSLDMLLLTRMFGGYWGHATFLAGLIRLNAPDARVMSVKLMNDNGTLDDHYVVTALNWLAEYRKSHRVDVVLMAFGRPKKPGEADPDDLGDAIEKLAQQGVQFVASAGNDHSHTEEIPACMKYVISVGAGNSAADHEPYSNHGPWVREWHPGTVVSIMPLTVQDGNGNGYARWSGTSFSAAIAAGKLAKARAAKPAASGGS